MSKKSSSSSQWLRRHKNDPYVQKAKQSNLRSRANFKIQDIQKKFSLFKKNQSVLELGSAPGGWTQYLISQHVGVVAVDLKPVTPIPGVIHLIGDITQQDFQKSLVSQIQTSLKFSKGFLTSALEKFDGIISDMAPNASGHAWLDSQKSASLVWSTIQCVKFFLKPYGFLISKYLQGEEDCEIMNSLKNNFQYVKRYRSIVSYKSSREIYYIAQVYKK